MVRCSLQSLTGSSLDEDVLTTAFDGVDFTADPLPATLQASAEHAVNVGLLDEAKKRIGSGIAAIVAVNEGRAAFAVAVTDDLTDRFSAVELVRKGVETLGGKGGGGRPDMAQGGGPDGTKAAEAVAAVKAALAG